MGEILILDDELKEFIKKYEALLQLADEDE
jgi:hypothetical protein